MRYVYRYVFGITFLDRKRFRMPTVTLSPKFQVVIPKQIRESLQLQPGQKLQAMVLGDRIELVPVQPMPRLRGFLPGLDTSVPRDADRP